MCYRISLSGLPVCVTNYDRLSFCRAKQLAVARLRVKIHELTDTRDEAVRAEEFLKEIYLKKIPTERVILTRYREMHLL